MLLSAAGNAVVWTQLDGPYGGEMGAAFEDSSGVAYVGHHWSGGLYRSVDGGVTWSRSDAGMPNPSAWAFAETGGYVFVSNGGGVYRTDVGGGVWEHTGFGVPSEDLLVVDWPDGTISMFAAAGQFNGTTGGVYRTDDLWQTWTLMDGGFPTHGDGSPAGDVPALESVDWGDGVVSVFAAIWGHAVYRTDDRGVGWTPTAAGIATARPVLHGLETVGTRLYYSGAGAGTSNISYTDDGGATWVSANDGLPIGGTTNTTVVHQHGGSLFTGVQFAGIHRSDNAAVSWAPKSSGYFGATTPSLFASVGPAILVASAAGLHRSDDNGESWVASQTGIQSSYVRHLFTQPGVIYAGTYQGLQYTSDGGTSWSQGVGIQSPDVNAVTMHDGTLYAGTQNGWSIGEEVYTSVDGGATWSPTTTLGGHIIRGLTSHGAYVFAGTEGGGVFRSDNGGGIWEPVNTGLSGSALKIRAFLPLGGLLLIGTDDGVYYTSDFGGLWTSAGAAGIRVLSLAGEGSVVYAGTDNGGGFHRSADGGLTWTQTGSSPGNGYSVAVVGPTVYAGTTRVQHSDDGGDTWTNDDTGMGAHSTGNPVFGLAVDGDTLYAGTSDAGVFAAYVGGPAASVTPDPLDFGSTEAGVAVTLTLTVTNTGSETLSVTDIVSTDSAFTVDATTLTVPSAGSATVDVTFTPATAGPYAADVVITHNATGGSTTVAATGTATAPPTSVSITHPTAAKTLPPGSATTRLAVDIEGHAAPGHWHWQLGTAFPVSGAAGGNEAAAGATSATISGLTDGSSYTVYVTLVDDQHNVLPTPVGDSVSFSVDTLPADAVQVLSAHGAAGSTVSVPVHIYDVSLLDVTGVDLTITYDATVLTPTSDVNGVTSFSMGDVVAAGWAMEQNVVTPGQLDVVLGGPFNAPLTGDGMLAYLAFDVDAAAPLNATSALGLTRADLNEGAVASTPVDGIFTVLQFMYGDVTGNGVVSGFDASHVLEHVAQVLVGGHHTFPIELQAPVWAPSPLTHDEAHVVADVDVDAATTSADASVILRHAVHIVPNLPFTPAQAPARHVVSDGYDLRATATSNRPGARIVVSLDASGIPSLLAGELLLRFDPALLRFVDVSVASQGKDQPLLAQRERDGRVAVAFASANPIDVAGGTLDLTFEALGRVDRRAAGSIRATHLRLNGALVDPGFEYRFAIEPYLNRLMANYPNPFNPETWIPFELAADADVTIRIYGMDGGLVRTLGLGARAMGEYRSRADAAHWDGANERGESVASGVYIYELTAGDYHSLRRMVVRK